VPDVPAAGRLAPGSISRWLRTMFRPRRTIWPTRDGWWCLFVVLALGIGAINTGNNLLYLLVSLLLGLIVVSGVLSEQAMRGVRLFALLPEEAHAGRPAIVGARVVNTKRWLCSYSLAVEPLGPAATPRRLYVPRLPPGGEHLLYWEETPARRGRQSLGGLRLTTRFPFGLFVKAGRPLHPAEMLVYPAPVPVSPVRQRQLEATGEAAARRRGQGTDLHNLRGYRAGDDPRLIHWRSTARTGAMMVRELLAPVTDDVRLILVDGGAGALLESGLSEAASLAAHVLGRGTGVELVGPGLRVPLGHGRAQRARVLAALALFEPGGAGAEGSGSGPERAAGRRLREVRVRIG
jgi:uncharacterized protein (DUF58 family)